MPHLDFLLHALDRVRGLHVVECDDLVRQGLDENLHATVAAQHRLERRLFLERDGLAILVLPCRDNTSKHRLCV
jgi:hypothetical protein